MYLLKNFRQPVLIVFTLVYLLNAFTTSFDTLLNSISTILLIIIVLQTLPVAGSANRNISTVLFMLGGILLFIKNASLHDWIISLGSNNGLVVLFISLPFLSFPLYYEDYNTTLKNISLKYISGQVRFSNVSAIITFFLCSLLNLAAFPIVYDLFQQSREFTNSEKILWHSMLRANFAAIFWSPNYVGVAVILHSLNVPWISILPMGLLFAFIVLVSNWLIILIQVKRSNLQKPQTHPNTSSIQIDNSNFGKLILIFISLISLVVVLNIFTNLGILVIVPLVAIAFPLLLAILQKKLNIYKEQLHKYYYASLLNIKNEVVIFAAAGFFGKSLEITGVGQIVPSLLRLENIHQPVIAILAIMAIMSILAFIGVHPVVTSSTIAATIGASTLGISHYAYTFTLLAAFGIAVMLSPFSGTTLVLSGLTKQSSFEMGPRLNLFYSLGMALFLALFIPFFIR